jgi:hypothetical protein
MGNIGGVRKKGLTLAQVEVAMREVVDAKFPGVFDVIGPSADFEGIALQVKVRKEDDLEYVLCWWDQGADDGVYPGLIGGRHPRMGDFGYWLLSVIEYGIAAKLKTRIYDEGIGYYRASELKKGAGTWEEYRASNSFMVKTYNKVFMDPIWRKEIPEPLWPWFDGKYNKDEE